MGDEGFAFCIGLALGFFAALILLTVMLHTGHTRYVDKHDAIVRRAGAGLVCRPTDAYPRLDCGALRRAVGPRRESDTFRVEK
jgi:hypothetical protein